MSLQRFQAANAKIEAKMEEWQLLFGTRTATAKLELGDPDPEAKAVEAIIQNGLPEVAQAAPTRKHKAKTAAAAAAAAAGAAPLALEDRPVETASGGTVTTKRAADGAAVGQTQKKQKGNTKTINGPDGHNLSLRI